mgnify:CR=1 FL=1
MAFTSNGQVQYLILDSLSDGSKYGLEIIEYITKKTHGGYILKKPTLYSCLTRLEKKGLVSSSFWGESEFGGKRHYYALTDEGKENLEILRKEFAGINFEVLNQRELEEEEEGEQKPVFLEQKNLFDYAKPAEPKEPIKVEEKKEESDVIDNQIDFFTFKKEEEEKAKDDGKFLDANETLTPSQLAQNKKIYDSSSELKKYRSRKSFSDNQIEMPVVYEKKEDDFEEKVASLKASLLASKQSHYDNNSYSNMVNKSTNDDIYTKPQQEIVEDVKDDATFITEKLDYIPYQKRITPPNIEINVSDENLPAPMRDSKLEPTYNDMVSKIMEKKAENIEKPKEVKVQKVERATNTFADYETLKNYYNSHGLEFKEYKRTVVERKHNTNFLKFISSIILFVLSAISSALIYWIASATGNLMTTSNFLYYTVPALFAVYAIILFIRYKCVVSRKATLKYNAIINFVVFLLASVVVFVLNICFGMTAETMASYLTSLLVPICALLIVFPINYYTTKFIYKKYAK